jgi:hypothetical protein
MAEQNYTALELIEKRKRLWLKHEDIERDSEFINHIVNDYLLQPEGKKIRAEIRKYPERFIELFFIIVNKDMKTIPFFLNEVQRLFVDEVNEAKELYRQGKLFYLWFIVLKGRQQGFTSFITAYQLACSITQKNFSGFTSAENADSTDNIFSDKAKVPYSLLTEKLKPTEEYNSKKELTFSKLNSKWRVKTVGNYELGRGKTLKMWHGTEVALWLNISSILAAAGEAIVKDGIVIFETTANGWNEFKVLWDDACNCVNNFIPLFFGWWLTPEYTTKFESEEAKAKFIQEVKGQSTDLYKKMNVLRESEGVTWEQLHWYYNKGKTQKHKLAQEYPCTPEEAFLHSGRAYFDVELLQNALIETQKIIPILTRIRDGLVIFENPIPKEKYVIGADVAEGLAEGDYSHGSVIKLSTMEQVAFMHGHYEPDIFGKHLVRLARFYNTAFLGVERNNHGHSVLNTVYNYEGYTNIYTEVDQTIKTEKPTLKKGWFTSEKTKYIMLDELDEALRNGYIIIKDPEFYKEALSVLVDDAGKANITGKDRVAANAIAYQMRKYYRTAKHSENFFEFTEKITGKNTKQEENK